MTTSTPNTRVKDLNLLIKWNEETIPQITPDSEAAAVLEANLPSDTEGRFVVLGTLVSMSGLFQAYSLDEMKDLFLWSIAADIKMAIMECAREVGVEDLGILTPYLNAIYPVIVESLFTECGSTADESEPFMEVVQATLGVVATTRLGDIAPGGSFDQECQKLLGGN